jgi:hypothetical protein
MQSKFFDCKISTLNDSFLIPAIVFQFNTVASDSSTALLLLGFIADNSCNKKKQK